MFIWNNSNKSLYLSIKITSMKKELSFVRFSAYTDMRLNELMKITGQNKSVVIRTLVDRSLNELTDEQGNWKLHEKGKTRKGQ